jgi:replication-associated recombination protein RarA
MAEYTKDLILAKIKQTFPNEEPEKIFSILGRNDERTQLAVLKLSEGDLEEMQRLLEVAKADWRDVLAWAEYPEEMKNDTWKMDAEEVKRIRERDRQQYLDWLNS